MRSERAKVKTRGDVRRECGPAHSLRLGKQHKRPVAFESNGNRA